MVERSHQESNQDQISDPISRPDQTDPDNQAFDCPECGKTFGAQKSVEAHMLRSHRIKPASLGGRTATENLEEDLNADLKKEAQLTNNMVVLARGKQRLKALDPESFRSLHGGQQQPEGSSTSKTLADVELAQYIRSLRETTGHPNNNGDSSETAVLKREVTDLREALRQKDLQNLRDENAKINEELKEIRSELRSSAGSNSSDLAQVVKSVENLLSEGLQHPGPLRNYLVPDAINIQKPSDAPALLRGQPAEARSNVLEELKKRGLVTRIVDVQKGGA